MGNNESSNERFYSYILMAFALIIGIIAISLAAKNHFTRNSERGKDNYNRRI